MTREAREGGGELVLVDLPCEREGLVLGSMAAILKDVLPGGGGESGAASVAAPRAELQVYRPDPPPSSIQLEVRSHRVVPSVG